MSLIEAARRAPGHSSVYVCFAHCTATVVGWFCHAVWGARWRGLENIPREGAFILSANHQSMLDPVLCGVAGRDRPLTYIARHTLFDFKPFAALIKMYGAVPIERNSPDSGAIKTALAELSAGRALLLYPEGTRCNDGRVAEFRPGVVLLARRAKVPLVPLVIEGAYDIWPRRRTFPRIGGAVEVEVGAPITPEQLKKRLDEVGSEAFLEEFRHSMEELRLRCRERVRQRTKGKWPPTGVADTPYWSA